VLRRAIERARRAGHRGAEAFVLFQYLIFLGQSGRYAEALGHAGHLIETYGAEGETFQQALTITVVGRCWAARAGHLDESLAYARQFRAIADEQGDVCLRAYRAMEGEPYFYLGRWDDVLNATGESLPLAWEVGETSPIVFGSSWRGLAALKVGRLDEARRVLDRALTFATSRQNTSTFSLAYLMQVRALLHLAEGQLQDALTLARKAIEFGAQSRFRLELGAAQRVLGQVLEASGDRAQAGATLAQSLETFEEIQSLPELGQTLLAYGRFKLGDDSAEGRRLIARARDLFARIGAVGWVAEADAAPGPSGPVDFGGCGPSQRRKFNHFRHQAARVRPSNSSSKALASWSNPVGATTVISLMFEAFVFEELRPRQEPKFSGVDS
jgi:tetratricopeptide (TPR) repeat protein